MEQQKEETGQSSLKYVEFETIGNIQEALGNGSTEVAQ